MTARDIGKTAPRGREAPLLDLALVSNSGISLPYPRYIRKATALACPSQVRATSPVKRPRLWGSGVRAPVALICQYIDRHKERFGGLADLPGPVRLRHQDRPGHRATPHYGALPWGHGNALAEAVNSLHKAELILWPEPLGGHRHCRGHHRRVGPLVQHHPATLRHRHTHPTEHEAAWPPTSTRTAGNNHNQINQPPRNPGLDTLLIWPLI